MCIWKLSPVPHGIRSKVLRVSSVCVLGYTRGIRVQGGVYGFTRVYGGTRRPEVLVALTQCSGRSGRGRWILSIYPNGSDFLSKHLCEKRQNASSRVPCQDNRACYDYQQENSCHLRNRCQLTTLIQYRIIRNQQPLSQRRQRN